jgi:chemotaxis family two-component system response regulator Rcp1
MSQLIRVLLVEDNAADADLTRECFATSEFPVELSVAPNGTDAYDFIRKRGPHSTAHTPDLILLDLNLPGINGRQILNELKRDAELRRIPVTILTSSTADRDITESYDIGANCYMVKPLDFKSFQAIVRTIENFWFTAAKLPQRPTPREATEREDLRPQP